MPKPRRYGFSILVDAFWLMLVQPVSKLRIAVVRAMAELLIRSPTLPLGCVDTYPSIPACAGINLHTAPVSVATRGNKRSRTQKLYLAKDCSITLRSEATENQAQRFAIPRSCSA